MDSFEQIFSVVYGPTVSNLRAEFLQEFRNLDKLGCDALLVYGNFNMIYVREMRRLVLGRSYNHALSNRFNSCINDLGLIELPLTDRHFTWAKSIQNKWSYNMQ